LSTNLDSIPVFLLTGFLGSGKTTLLARLLKNSAFHDSAVLINEFGEVGLDHHLLGRIDDTMVLLSSGCLCCTIRGELAFAIRELYSKRERGLIPRFRRLIVETSGLADPLPAIATIAADKVLKHHFRIGAVIATIDAVNGRKTLLQQPESLKQAAIADRLVLTKTDLCDQRTVMDVIDEVRIINPDSPLYDACDDRLDLADVLVEQSAPIQVPSGISCAEVPPGMLHGRSTSSFSLVIDRPVDWTLFGLWLTMLLNRHGENILRVKGLLNVEGTDRPVAIHGVQQLVHPPTHLSMWPDDDRRSRLIFILRGGSSASISRSLQAFGLLDDGNPPRNAQQRIASGQDMLFS
jgi:G3E family GTPase